MKLFSEISFLSVISNTSSQLIVRLITSATTLIATFFISYSLGLHVFGSFTKVITFVGFFYLLVDFGLNTIFLKNHLKDAEENFGNLLATRYLISFFLFLSILVIANFLPFDSSSNTGFSHSEKIGIMIFSITLFIQAFTLSINALLQKNLSYSLSIYPTIISSIALIIFIFIAIFLKNFYFLLLSYFYSGIIFIAYAYYLLSKKHKPKIRPVKDLKAFIKHNLSPSLPLALMLFLNVIYFRADIFILSLFKPNLDVGVYGFSYKFFEFIIAVPTFFANTIYVSLLEKKNDQKVFFKTVKTYLKFLLAFSLFIFVAVFLFSPLLSLFNQNFNNSVKVLRILSASLPFFFLTSILQWVFVIKNRTTQLLFIYGFSMVTSILLNIIFIPYYSYIASSYITVVVEAIVLFLMMLFLFSNNYFIKQSHE